MKDLFYIEGYKSKTTLEYENSLILNDENSYENEAQATAKAGEYFAQNENLGLIIIYRGSIPEERLTVKFIHRTHEGELEEVNSWWSSSSCM